MVLFTVAEERNLLRTHFLHPVDDSVEDIEDNSFSKSVHLWKTCIRQTCSIPHICLPSYRQHAAPSWVRCLQNVFHGPPLIQQVEGDGDHWVRGREQRQNPLFITLAIERGEAHAGNVDANLRKEGWLGEPPTFRVPQSKPCEDICSYDPRWSSTQSTKAKSNWIFFPFLSFYM